MRLMFWNVKYFGPNSDNFRDRIQDIAGHVRRWAPDIVVLVELTSRADETLDAIKKELQAKELFYQSKSIDVGGGNHEHFGVLLAPSFGLGSEAGLTTRDERIGGGTRKIGHISIGKVGDTTAFGLYICHPSPCAFTNTIALKEAVTFLDEVPRGRSLMVGDYNAKDWTVAGHGGTHPGVATHLGASGKLCTIDGAVFRDMEVAVERVQRVTSAAAQSDHGYMIFTIK